MKEALYFAVTGKPVLHSRSPQMHSSAFEALGLAHRYTRIAADSAAEALTLAREIGFSGLNVTAPFKEEMHRLLGAGAAKGLSAVNTVSGIGGEVRAFNTDVQGVLDTLAEHDVVVRGRRAAVLGAGGAGLAAAQALRDGGASVTVLNRTAEKAERAAALLGIGAAPLAGAAGERLVREAEIVVSCLSTAERVVPVTAFSPAQIILEAGYAHESALVQDARSRGALVIGGQEWLLHQGAGAFQHFTGVRPPLAALREGLALPRPGSKPSIALVGMMGAGKSSVAGLLARELALPAIELDERIERKAGRTIREIFQGEGEEAFRRLEESSLEAAAREPSHVLSCGGGLPTRSANRDVLRSNYLTVWLWVRPATALERDGGSGKRPLLTRCRDASGLAELMKERTPAYVLSADLILSTEGRTPAEVAARLAYEIHSAR